MDKFVASLVARCKQHPGGLGLSEADDPRVIRAAEMLWDWGAVSRIKFYSKGPIKSMVPASASESVDGLDMPSQLEAMAQDIYEGNLHASLGGCVATTAEVIRAGIRGVGLAEGVRTVSGSFVMNRDGQVMIYADCGVVIQPKPHQYLDIAEESVKLWRCLFPDQNPKVAFLSFSTMGSAASPESERMRTAALSFRERCPDVDVDGELQFDAAMDRSIGIKKAPGSSVAGQANIFVFPDLGAGNIAYKITQRLAGFQAYGPILQGLRSPFSDLSRGSTVDDIVVSALINLLRSAPVP